MHDSGSAVCPPNDRWPAHTTYCAVGAWQTGCRLQRLYGLSRGEDAVSPVLYILSMTGVLFLPIQFIHDWLVLLFQYKIMLNGLKLNSLIKVEVVKYLLQDWQTTVEQSLQDCRQTCRSALVLLLSDDVNSQVYVHVRRSGFVLGQIYLEFLFISWYHSWACYTCRLIFL